MDEDALEINGAVVSWSVPPLSGDEWRMEFCLDATAAGGERSVLSADAKWLEAGIADSGIVVAPDEGYAAVYHLSDTSSGGCEVFRLRPDLEHVGSMDRHGELSPPIFSPGSQYIAQALRCHRGFLDPSGKPDPTKDYFEVPDTEQLTFELGDLCLQALPDGDIEIHPIQVRLPADFEGFLAEYNVSVEEALAETFHVDIEFHSDRLLRVECTKLAEPVDVALPIGAPIVVDLSHL